MIDDERHDHGDEFWGSTPDWTDDAARPRRVRRDTDITGAIKNIWGAAMSSGASPTREHRVVDVDAEATRSTAGAIDPGLFDDLDDDFELPGERELLDATTELPRVDAERRATPVPTVARGHAEGGAGRIDPLLARIGAVAVVTTLLVPLGLGLGSGDGDDTISTTASEAAVVTLPPATTADTVEPAATETESPVALDPADLPPAIPADREASSSTVDDAAPVASTDNGSQPAASSADAGAATSSASQPSSSDDGESSPTAADTVVAQKVCAIDYIVQTGDYWIGIADAAGVPLAELLDANAATASTALYPGADICLPAGSATPTTTAAPTTAPTTTEAPTTTAAPSPDPVTTDAPTTTTATTTTTAVPTTSPAGPEDIKQIIRDVWPDDLEERALTIAFRESRYVPTAQNFCCYGLFQIYWEVHDSWLVGIGVTSAEQLFDPLTNAQAAYALYQRAGGWGPWSQTNY